jgi:uncharacterized repeat protein (TIGR03803 family)
MKLSGWIAGLLAAVASWLVSVACAAESGTPIHIVHQFGTNVAEICGPNRRLLEVDDGEFYGVSQWGGLRTDAGAIFKITKSGQLTPLYQFDWTNGTRPSYGLIRGVDGHFYGTCGGIKNNPDGFIYRFATNGELTVLHSFTSQYSIGFGGLVQTPDGAFYGTSYSGGTNDFGVVYRYRTNGGFSVAAHFGGAGVGYYPASRLIDDGAGSFYGCMRYHDRNGNYPTGPGTVFRFSTNGALSLVFAFDGVNGSQPTGDLAFGQDGSLYGTTFGGGKFGLGTVFKLTTNGVLTTLVDFTGTNGARPASGLLQSREGYLYGVTAYSVMGATYGFGTAYRLTTNGQLTTLVRFDGTNGANAYTEFIQGRDGSIYGAVFDAAYRMYVNGGTVLRFDEQPTIVSVTANSMEATLKWHSFSNRIYRLESKSLTGDTNWIDHGVDIPSLGNQTAYTVPTSPSAQRIYRVALLP